MKKKFLIAFIISWCVVAVFAKNDGLILNVSASDGVFSVVENVALNKSIEFTTGTSGFPSFVKENLIDGNIYNIAEVIFDGEHTGVGYVIDLGKSYTISEFKLYAIIGNGSGRDQIWIDYSLDKSTWTNIYSRNNDIFDGFSSQSMTENVLTVNNFGTINARYIKLTSWTYACWTEFEIFAATLTYELDFSQLDETSTSGYRGLASKVAATASSLRYHYFGGGNTLTTTTLGGVKALDFNYNNGFLVRASDDVLFGSKDITIEMWIYKRRTNNTGPLLQLNGAAMELYYLGEPDAERKMQFMPFPNTRERYTFSDYHDVEAWNHIVITRTYDTDTSATTKLYSNGELKGTYTATGLPVFTAPTDFFVGNYSGSNDIGTALASLKVYNKVFSAEDINAKFNAEKNKYHIKHNISVYGYNSNNISVVHGYDYKIEPIVKGNLKFYGYYTEKNGGGTKLTDEKGNSLEGYPFEEDITAYPYFADQALIEGASAVTVGDKNIKYSVTLYTNKEDIYYSTIYVKYPNTLSLIGEPSSNTFDEVSLEKIKTDGGFNVAEFACIYSYDGDAIPAETAVKAFDLYFDISKNARPTNATIEITSNSILMNEKDYLFDDFTNQNVAINPKLAESIIISGEKNIDEPTQYIATVLPDYTTDKSVIWSVSDETIATISEDGILTPIKNGTVTITATATDGSGVYAQTRVCTRDYEFVESIEISGETNIYKPIQYNTIITPDNATYKMVEWSVSDETIATISQDGILTPIKNGTVTITATATDGSGVYAQIDIEVIVYATINSITSDGTWSEEFENGKTEYVVYVGENETSFNVSATYTKGTLKVNGSTLISGRTKTVDLTDETTVITIKRTNVDGYTDITYTLTVIKTQDAFIADIETTDEGYDFDIVLNEDEIDNFETATVIAAIYADNGEFLGFEQVPVTKGTTTLTATVKTDEIPQYAKLMLWDSINGLNPLCNEKEITIQ